MSSYRPAIENPIPLILLKPTYSDKLGVTTASYPNPNDVSKVDVFFGSFKTYGGTEKTVNGVYSVEDTANIVTWFRPDIKSNCHIALGNTNAVYEILGEPENINQRNQFLKFKVRRIKGKA